MIVLNVKQTALWIWIFLLGGGVLFHFCMTALYLTPENPVRSRTWSQLEGYMHPWFAQGWKLFAPNPVSTHQSVEVKVKYRHSETGEWRETDWLDITAPLIRKHQSSRISSEARSHRYMQSGIRYFLDKDPKKKKRGERILQRTASTAVEKQQPRKHIGQIKARVVTHEFPRFSERHQPDDKGTLYFKETKWMKYSPVHPSIAKEWPQ